MPERGAGAILCAACLLTAAKRRPTAASDSRPCRDVIKSRESGLAVTAERNPVGLLPTTHDDKGKARGEKKDAVKRVRYTAHPFSRTSSTGCQPATWGLVGGVIQSLCRSPTAHRRHNGECVVRAVLGHGQHDLLCGHVAQVLGIAAARRPGAARRLLQRQHRERGSRPVGSYAWSSCA